MDVVGFNFEYYNCYLYEFFGGQCQCIGVVRVFAFKFKVIVVDELVFVLDVLI